MKPNYKNSSYSWKNIKKIRESERNLIEYVQEGIIAEVLLKEKKYKKAIYKNFNKILIGLEEEINILDFDTSDINSNITIPKNLIFHILINAELEEFLSKEE